MIAINSYKLITLIGLCSLFFFSACERNRICIKGNNDIQTLTLNPTDFDQVTLAGSFDLDIKQGSSHKVKITGDDNILDFFEAKVRNGNCKLQLEDGCYKNYELRVEVTMPDLNAVYLDGSGNVEIKNFANQSELTASIDGSGNITINRFEGVEKGYFYITGSGNILFDNEIDSFDEIDIQISGSGDYKGYNAIGKSVFAEIDGSGNINANATVELDARIDGSGDIRYKGNPTLKSSVRGSGKITRVR